ncbi:thiamine diphosphokinase [Bavariicoccus seileri]|uniref:thiamine diphosphokinase n=1 Tax=Bavariicoccus seileri TaxID=549685 RepID=UPI003F8F358C
MIHVVLGGPDPALTMIGFSPNDLVVGVDRGAMRLLDQNFSVDLAVGDFDSVSEEEFNTIASLARKVVRLKPEKDDTDTEYALKMIADMNRSDDIMLYGAFKGRLDHTLSNIWLGYQPRFASILTRLHYRSQRAIGCFFTPGTHLVTQYKNWKYLSFISLTPIKGLTLDGSKYPLDNVDLSHPMALISNEFLPSHPVNKEKGAEKSLQMTLSFEEGTILMLQTIDD